ncbi:hypothetical protein GCM10010317_005540 [Streptomyces mirabilis]|nr:hypothetical protein GCM10010317_005540 [Streptomyces mirabilis]
MLQGDVKLLSELLSVLPGVQPSELLGGLPSGDETYGIVGYVSVGYETVG